MDIAVVGSCLSTLTIERLLSLPIVVNVKPPFRHFRSDALVDLIEDPASFGCPDNVSSKISSILESFLTDDQ